ncbi:MAG: hypothetical protein V4736_15720 [Bdellovibrionota bacterium]
MFLLLLQSAFAGTLTMSNFNPQTITSDHLLKSKPIESVVLDGAVLKVSASQAALKYSCDIPLKALKDRGLDAISLGNVLKNTNAELNCTMSNFLQVSDFTVKF